MNKSSQPSKLILGLPKGSLQDSTFMLMRKAGFNITVTSRSYLPRIDDPELEGRLIRAQEISRYVEQGVLDAGITGKDWILENESDVVEIADLVYAKVDRKPVRWVVAVPEDSPIQKPADLEGKRIATEAVGITRQYLQQHGVTAEIEFSWGATEVKAPELVDAIVEITETGTSLQANNLRILDTVMESTTKLIANRDAYKNGWKKEKIDQLSILIQGALTAETGVLLKLNIAESNLDKAIALLPALHTPTVNNLADKGWFSIETVINKSVVREVIPKLKVAGAEGIIEVPLNKIIS